MIPDGTLKGLEKVGMVGFLSLVVTWLVGKRHFL
jgi:hypothetical protein